MTGPTTERSASRYRSESALRLAGTAGVVGGLGWAGLTLLTFAADRGPTVLWYGTLDAVTPLALALAVAGVAGHRARTRAEWGRLATAGFVVLLAGLLGSFAGSAVYVGANQLRGWTLSVWSYALALVGTTLFGAGLLRGDVPPRSGAVLLASALPVGLTVSLSLAVGGVADEAIVPVGPGVLLGAGVAALGWWVRSAE